MQPMVIALLLLGNAAAVRRLPTPRLAARCGLPLRSRVAATALERVPQPPLPPPLGRKVAKQEASLLTALDLLFVRPISAPLLRFFANNVDRGDFRWEFLAPWLDRDMTQVEKWIVGCTFVWLALAVQLAFDPSASFTDHLSQIALFFGYAVGNRVGYRLIAIGAAAFELIAHLVDTRVYVEGVEVLSPTVEDDLIPVFYNILFIVINTYYVLRWQLDRQDVASTNPLEEELYRSCLEPLGIGRRPARQLLKGAEWLATEEDRVVFVEGQPLEDLYISVAGQMGVVKGGVPVASIAPFQVIGEVALLENLQSEGGSLRTPARATIVAEAGARYVRIPQTVFYRLMSSDREFERCAQLMICRTLSRKLGKAREEQQVMSTYVVQLAREAARASSRRDLAQASEGKYGQEEQPGLGWEPDGRASAEVDLAKYDVGLQ